MLKCYGGGYVHGVLAPIVTSNNNIDPKNEKKVWLVNL